jgi:hypothetical protein
MSLDTMVINEEELTWTNIKDAAISMFNIMGTNKEVAFAQKVWDKLSELNLTSYSNNLELIKLKILFVAFGVFYKDFCKVSFEKQTEFNYDHLLKVLKIDEFTLGRFYQLNIKPKENKLPENFNASKALEELSKHFRKEIYQLLSKVLGSGSTLFISLWRTTNPDLDQDKLDIIKILMDTSPASCNAQSWINSGCYNLIEDESEF